MLVVMFSPLMLFCSCLVVGGSLLSISSSTWSGVWVGMELNLFSFLILMNGGSFFDLEPLIKYFVVQSLGSVVFIFSVVYVSFFLETWMMILLVLGLFLKIGIFPFHSWVPSVVVKSRWIVGGLVLTWQKLAPLVFLMLISSSVVFISVLFMVVIGGAGGLNQSSVRGMASYSSFVHMSWMMVGLLYSFFVFLFYFFIYSMSLFLFFLGCSNSGKSSLGSQSFSLLGLIGVLMMMGVPPFLGFLSKLLVMLSSPTFALVVCLLGSVVSLKFYTSFFYSMFLNSGLYGIEKELSVVSLSLVLNVLGLFLIVVVLFL
uniref:NADH-ubiquinone oxidoreductase chain 2 n=1 Tax=Arcuatula senhousia TaxID=1954227 RepID=E2DHV6_ARCSE|nr:NADH dehydrogenase subunit 2 [Arcuatula senhousia]